MNKCWQVARTYWRRLRFWIFGTLYVLIAMAFLQPVDEKLSRWIDVATLYPSLMFAGIMSCLVALHLRRLLSGPLAHVVPGFAGPHLFVGAIASLLIWVGVPLTLAQWYGRDSLQLVATHSLAGTLLALVLLFPRAIWLLAASPVLLVWPLERERPYAEVMARFFSGEFPTASAAAIAVACLAYPICALLFLRTGDRAATFSDDLVVDRSHQVTSRWKNALLRLRDGTFDWRLGGPGMFGWRWRRWQLPVLVSWTEVGLLFALAGSLMTISWFLWHEEGVAWFITSIAGAITLFLPLGSWRFRCSALAGEFVRPVARRQFVREFLSAMLLDFLRWTVLAALLSAIGYLFILQVPNNVSVGWVLWRHMTMFWSLAALLYGVALTTIRMRYWLPWFLGLLLGSAFGLSYLAALMRVYLEWAWRLKLPPDSFFMLFPIFYATFALFLIWLTYRRWLEMEID